MADDDDDERMISNPAYARLKALKERVSNNRTSIEATLSDAKTRMHDGETWTGSAAAEPWTEEVSGRHNRLPDLVTGVIEAIEEGMSQVPEEISAPPAGHQMPY